MKKNTLASENIRLNEELLKMKAELASLKKDKKSLSRKLDTANRKKSELQKNSKKKSREYNRVERRARPVTFDPIKGHKYSEVVVKLCVMLYCNANCSFRSIVKTLECFNFCFKNMFENVPCANTIENWVKKSGLDIYQNSHNSFQNRDYSIIVDESMMIGSEKMLVILGIPAEHLGRPLIQSDCTVLDIAVGESWSGKKIAGQIRKVVEKVGHEPKYIISDNASVMVKGAKCSGVNHLRDISHSLGMYLEKAYKNQVDYKEYIHLMNDIKAKNNMKEVAYLLPPSQRAIARFMNISLWVKWSQRMLERYRVLSETEREVFSFIPENRELINELNTSSKCVRKIEYIIKRYGLSKNTIQAAIDIINSTLTIGNKRMKSLGNNILAYLDRECQLLGSSDKSYNNSSDVVESIFGVYKARKSKNKLYGVTSFVLFLPVYTKLFKCDNEENINIKSSLEKISLSKICIWKNHNLTPNLVNKRSLKLSESA